MNEFMTLPFPGQIVYYSGVHLTHGLYRLEGYVDHEFTRAAIRTLSRQGGFYSVCHVDIVDLRVATDTELLLYVEDL